MIYWTKEGKEHVLSQILTGEAHLYTFEKRYFTSSQLHIPYRVVRLPIRENELSKFLDKVKHNYDRYLELNVHLGNTPNGVLLASIRGEHIND